MAPATRSHRKYRLPCLVMLPSLSLPPVVCCFGTSPIQAAKPRPDLNAFQSPISATRAVATIGPTPGISSSRRLGSQERWPADRLAERCRIVRIILAAFEIGLYIARWHQLHRMTESLQLAAPMMSGRTSFDTNKARRPIREKLQHLRTANALSYHYRSGVIDTVNLEYRLRNIETNRDNLAHGRLPSKWFVSTQPPYGTPMPQSGRRPQHQFRLIQRGLSVGTAAKLASRSGSHRP